MGGRIKGPSFNLALFCFLLSSSALALSPLCIKTLRILGLGGFASRPYTRAIAEIETTDPFLNTYKDFLANRIKGLKKALPMNSTTRGTIDWSFEKIQAARALVESKFPGRAEWSGPFAEVEHSLKRYQEQSTINQTDFVLDMARVSQLLTIAEQVQNSSYTVQPPKVVVAGGRRWYSHEATFTDQLMQDALKLESFLKRNPHALVIASHQALTFDEIIDLLPYPVFLVGLTDKTLSVDGTHYNPARFLAHDIGHLNGMTRANLIFGSRSKVIDVNYEAKLKENLEFHNRFKGSLINIPTKRQQALIKCAWFKLFHEDARDIARNYNSQTIKRLLSYNANIGLETVPQFKHDFATRTQIREDFGQYFKNPPTPEEIDWTVTWLENFAAE